MVFYDGTEDWTAADFAGIGKEVSAGYLRDATAGTPEHLLNIMAQVIEALLLKINVPLEEAADFAGQVKEKRMGELFSNFEAYDVQAIRREAREEGKIEARNEDIEKLIHVLEELAIPVEEIKLQLIKQYHLSEKEIEEKIKNS